MSELSFTIEDRAGLPVLIDGRGGVRPAGLHERAMWKRIKELEAKLRAVGGVRRFNVNIPTGPADGWIVSVVSASELDAALK